jgi:molybdate transport system substrate-binding protein
MKNMKRFLTVILILIMILVTACGQTPKTAAGTQAASSTVKAEPQETTQPVELLVSAAASLKESLGEIETAYEEKNKNVKLTFSFGSSGALQQQIENGAAVDVFVSAATKQMDALMDKGLIIDETRKEFLENEVVLIVPKDSDALTDFMDLTSDKIRHIGLGEPKGVPVGQYAEEVLTKLNILDKIKKKVVYGNDVKEVLTWVETGNCGSTQRLP